MKITPTQIRYTKKQIKLAIMVLEIYGSNRGGSFLGLLGISMEFMSDEMSDQVDDLAYRAWRGVGMASNCVQDDALEAAALLREGLVPVDSRTGIVWELQS